MVMNRTSNQSAPRRITIEFLYLDLARCTRCRDTDRNLEAALADAARILRANGVNVEVRKIHVQSEEQARELTFVSSPTIRVNGRDIAFELKESRCEGCSCGCEDDGVTCRVWTYQGRDYDAAPKELIVDAVLKAASDASSEPTHTVNRIADVPENLKRFFAAKRREESARSNACC
jgi:hypothetical protein